MTELIPTINEIVKYGLQSNFTTNKNERNKLLEKSLVKIYSLYFEIECTIEETDFPDFIQPNYQEIRQNIESNFPDFGFYKTIIDFNDFENKEPNGIGDAIDDLTDITLDLLEIKMKIEKNSLEDGLSYFQFIFKGHTQQHILDLLNYMKKKELN